MAESKWTPIGNMPIRITDLNLTMFEDPDLAEDLAADFLKLFGDEADAADKLTDERWYRRMWVSISTLEASTTCRSVRQTPQA